MCGGGGALLFQRWPETQMVLDRETMVPHAEAGSHSREEGTALCRLGIGFAVLLGQGLLGRSGKVRKWDMLCFGCG